MKKQNFLKIAGLAVLAVFMAACPVSLLPPVSGSPAIPEGQGLVSLSIAGSASRTIFPDDWNDFTYSVTFTSGEKKETQELVDGSGSFTLDAPFTWTGLVEAKLDDDVVGIANLGSFELLEGGTKEFKNILIQPAPGNDGILSWEVEFPDDLTAADLYYRKGETGAETTIDLLTSGRVGLVSSGVLNLEPGDYLFRAVLSFATNNLSAGKVEAVHIYPDLTSTLAWSFPMEAFFEVEDVTVTVPINASAGITITGIVMNADGIAPISEYTEEGSDYIFVIPGLRTDLNDVENLRLDITTTNSVVNVPAKDYAKVDGALDMDAVDIFKLVGTVGTNGTISVTLGTEDPVEYKQNFQLDLIKGTAGTIAVEANDLYKIDASSGAGPFTMTADVAASASFIREYYAINVPTPSNGTVTLSGHVATPSFRALPGTTITVTIATVSGDYLLPDTGPDVKYDGGSVTVSGSGATWTFTMPTEDVTVTALFLARGHIVIYSGGPRYTIVASEMSAAANGGGTNGTYAYANSLTEFILEAPGQGRNGGTAITYNEGGTHAGESSFALSCAAAFDTTYSGALSFWMKANANANVAWFGTGNNPWTNVITYFSETHNNNAIPVTTEWQHYIVPIPMSQAAINRFFFWKASPGTNVFYIDDIEFVPAVEVELTSITIPATTIEFPYPGAVTLNDLIGNPSGATGQQLVDMRFTYTYEGVTATLRAPGAQGNLGHRWSELVPSSNYTLSVTGDVTLAGDARSFTPNDRSIPFTAALIFKGVTSNPMAGSFSAGGEIVTVATVPNGSIAVSGLDAMGQAPVGSTITITLSPNTNYRYDDNTISVVTASSTPVTVTRIGQTLQWTFVQPSEPVTVTAAFTPVGLESLYVIENWEATQSNGAWNGGYIGDLTNAGAPRRNFGYWMMPIGAGYVAGPPAIGSNTSPLNSSGNSAFYLIGQGGYNTVVGSNGNATAGFTDPPRSIGVVWLTPNIEGSTPNVYPASFGRNFPTALNLSGRPSISIRLLVRGAGDTYALALHNGGNLSTTGNTTGEIRYNAASSGTAYSVPITQGGAGEWPTITVPMSDFTSQAGFDITAVTGWSLILVSKTTAITQGTTAEGTFVIEAVWANAVP